MVRSAAVGFGTATMLALAGSMMLGGQARLGTKHLAAAQAGPVKAIQDKPAQVPMPMQSIVTAPVAPAVLPRQVVSTPRSSRGRAQVHAAASSVARPQAGSAALGQPFQISQLMQLGQSPAISNVFPSGEATSTNGLLPGILQQLTSPGAESLPAAGVQPAQGLSPMVPAQPSLPSAAVTPVSSGGGKDEGDGQK
jgi:hypothetical protein